MQMYHPDAVDFWSLTQDLERLCKELQDPNRPMARKVGLRERGCAGNCRLGGGSKVGLGGQEGGVGEGAARLA